MSILTAMLKLPVPARYYPGLRRSLGVQPWCRVVMNREVKRFIESLNRRELDVLEISGSREDIEHFRSYRIADYPEYDVCQAPLALDAFDLIIAEQVFEHVKYPDKAASHVYQMLRPGGAFIITTPFLLKVHGFPSDYYRWTRDGLAILLENAGFSDVETGSWGNRQCLRADLRPGMEWTFYIPLLHSLKNEPQLPISVWAFARKI